MRLKLKKVLTIVDGRLGTPSKVFISRKTFSTKGVLQVMLRSSFDLASEKV